MGDSDEESSKKRREKFKRERDEKEDWPESKRKLETEKKPFIKREHSPFNKSFKRAKRDDSFNIGSTHPYDWNAEESKPQIHSSHLPPSSSENFNREGNLYPYLMSFKQFILDQDDDIDEISAVKRYCDYKQLISAKVISEFFEMHKTEQWFQEKYHPKVSENFKTQRRKCLLQRVRSFFELHQSGYIEMISLDSDNIQNIEKLMNACCILLEGGAISDLDGLDLPYPNFEKNAYPIEKDGLNSSDMDANPDTTTNIKVIGEDGEVRDEDVRTSPHKINPSPSETNSKLNVPLISKSHMTNSIYVKGISNTTTREDFTQHCNEYNLLRVHLTDPLFDKQSELRRGWLTFSSSVDVREIIPILEQKLNIDRKPGSNLVFSLNKELSRRVKPLLGILNTLPVVISDIRLASLLIEYFDSLHGIFQEVNLNQECKQLGLTFEIPLITTNLSKNPILINVPNSTELSSIKEKLTAAEKAEEEEEGVIPCEVSFKRDKNLFLVLDRMIWYLRLVHSFDYYSTTNHNIEDWMPHRCGMLSIRGDITPTVTLIEVQTHNSMHEDKVNTIIDSKKNTKLQSNESDPLGKRNYDDAIEKFIELNTRKIENEKYLCPLSGKKFKGPEYVRKHIFNKHTDKIDEVKIEVDFFNNYLSDNERPMPLLKVSSYYNSQHGIRDKEGRIHNEGGIPKHGLKPPEFPMQSQGWPFPPAIMFPPHAPPFPPPIDYPRFQSYGRGGKRTPRKSDDNRKPISYKDWDDPNLDN